ncbi:DUF1753-domain-containing protein [Panus rudis PR-1116 ss-1]|nr:DUF1753-domain-containing protein [Panus rudis PR-1116 ss-1]
MKLMLKPEWRLRPLSSFLGVLDLKSGVIVALFFALFNKVAGVYGLIAVLSGAGGSAAQVSLYIYSVIGLVALAWGLKVVGQEDAKHSLYFAHLFFADHILSTAWTVFFAVLWWVYTPHDGRKQTNSAAQEELAKATSVVLQHMTDEERAYGAMKLWDQEKKTATLVIVLGWLSKFYFALLLYSYAIHLRKGSYRSLPLSKQTPPTHYQPINGLASATLPDEEEEVEDFYRLPVRTPAVPASGQGHSRSGSHSGHIRSGSNGGSSVGSFADFVSAPGRGSSRRTAIGRKSSLNPAVNGSVTAKGSDGLEVDEVLFDEDEASTAVSGSRSVSGSASGSGGSDEEWSTGSGHVRKKSRARA